MSLPRLPRIGHQTLFWAAFAAVALCIGFAAVIGLRPTAPVKLSPPPTRIASEARAGKMILDHGSAECQQVSFNNDTGEITGTETVRCLPRQRAAPPVNPADTGNAAGVFGSMRNAFRGARK